MDLLTCSTNSSANDEDLESGVWCMDPGPWEVGVSGLLKPSMLLTPLRRILSPLSSPSSLPTPLCPGSASGWHGATIQTSSAGQWGTRSPPLLSQSSASDLLLLLLGLSLPEAVPSSARSSKLSEPHLWSGRSVHLVSPLLLLGGLRRW